MAPSPASHDGFTNSGQSLSKNSGLCKLYFDSDQQSGHTFLSIAKVKWQKNRTIEILCPANQSEHWVLMPKHPNITNEKWKIKVVLLQMLTATSVLGSSNHWALLQVLAQALLAPSQYCWPAHWWSFSTPRKTRTCPGSYSAEKLYEKTRSRHAPYAVWKASGEKI